MLRLLKSQGLFICLFIHSFTQRMCIAKHYSLSLFFSFFLTGIVLSRAVDKAGSPPVPLASLGFVPLCPVLTQKEVYVLERNIFFFWLFTFCQVNNLHNRTLCTENPRACVVVHSECFLYKQLSGPRKPDRPRPPLVCKNVQLTEKAGRLPFLPSLPLLPGETVFDISNSEMIPCHGENLEYRSRVLLNSYMWILLVCYTFFLCVK